MSEYPQHDKIKSLGNDNQTIGSFLEWLQGRGYSICEYYEGRRKSPGFYPSENTIQEWLADYFEIDLDALEQEKQKIYSSLTA